MQQEDELVVTVCALVHTSWGGDGVQHCGRGWAPHRKPQLYLGHMPVSPVAHQHLKEELGGEDAVGNGVMAGGVLQTQPPGDPSSGNMLQILPSTCQPLTPPSSPPTLGEHLRVVILPLPLIPSFIHSSSKADSTPTMGRAVHSFMSSRPNIAICQFLHYNAIL